MTKAQYEIDRAFLLISSLPVSGNGVEIMAAAKEHLRAAYKLAKEKSGEYVPPGCHLDNPCDPGSPGSPGSHCPSGSKGPIGYSAEDHHGPSSEELLKNG